MSTLLEKRNKVKNLEDEVAKLQEQYEMLQSISRPEEADQPDSNETTAPPEEQPQRQGSHGLEKGDITPPRMSIIRKRVRKEEDYYDIPPAAHHEYFDELINSIMVDGLQQFDEQEIERESNRKKQLKLDQMKNSKYYKELKSKYVPRIQLENIYRLGGMTAFPVNDPSSQSYEEVDEDEDEDVLSDGNDKYLGIRFDIFDVKVCKYVTPHYIILKKSEKNDNWDLFKTTIPKFIPYKSIAAKYLNIDLFSFASEIKENLINLQLKKGVFISLKESLNKPSKLDHDLGFNKININILNRFEIILICNLYEITNVIVIGSYEESQGLLTSQLKKTLELMLKGCEIGTLDTQFFQILEECGISV